MLDLILIVVVVAFAVSGYRQGFIVGVLSCIGFLVGAAVGARLLSSGGELLTVLVGDGATLELGEAVAEAARHERREVESTVLRGGQQVYPLLLGVE